MPKVIFDWDTKYKKGIIISEFLDVIREHFSIENPDAKMLLKRFGAFHHIEPRKYAITSAGRFEPGLLFDLLKYLKNNEVQYETVITPLLEKELCIGFDDLQTNDIQLLSMTLRPYQDSAIKKGMKIGLGTVIIGTAGGKTLLMATLINTLRKNRTKKFKTIVILPAQLVDQTYKDFLDYGISSEDMSQWGGDHEFKDSSIVIASSKTLETKLEVFKKINFIAPTGLSSDEIKGLHKEHMLNERERKKKWSSQRDFYIEKFKDVDLLLVDEVHSLRKGNTINDVVDKFQTRHRFGFTGTLPESLIDVWNIVGVIGPVIEDVSSAQLRDEKYIADVHATILKIKYKNPPDLVIDKESPVKAYKEECNYLFTNNYRNNVIAQISKKTDKNTLILVNSLQQGEILFKLLSGFLPEKSVYYIRGEVPNSEREEIRQLMEKKDNVVCIAMSKIFSTGVNVRNLHYIIFALTGKAKIRFLQSIGRGLRLHENKDRLELFDIVDELHYSLKHYEGKRIELYEKEKITYEIKHLSEQ